MNNIWYAVQTDPMDDWGYGSHDYKEALKMFYNLKQEYPDALIAVIDATHENAVCIKELRPNGLEFLLQAADSVRSNFGDVVYCDTDSIKYLDDHD